MKHKLYRYAALAGLASAAPKYKCNFGPDADGLFVEEIVETGVA